MLKKSSRPKPAEGKRPYLRRSVVERVNDLFSQISPQTRHVIEGNPELHQEVLRELNRIVSSPGDYSMHRSEAEKIVQELAHSVVAASNMELMQRIETEFREMHPDDKAALRAISKNIAEKGRLSESIAVSYNALSKLVDWGVITLRLKNEKGYYEFERSVNLSLLKEVRNILDKIK